MIFCQICVGSLEEHLENSSTKTCDTSCNEIH